MASVIAAFRFWDSGLEHQPQRRGQPLKNTVVRMPGPSLMQNFWMLNSFPLQTLPLPLPMMIISHPLR